MKHLMKHNINIVKNINSDFPENCISLIFKGDEPIKQFNMFDNIDNHLISYTVNNKNYIIIKNLKKNLIYSYSCKLGKVLYNKKCGDINIFCLSSHTKSIIAGILYGLYQFDKFKSIKKPALNINFYVNETIYTDIMKYIKIIDIQWEIRDLVNMPFNHLNSLQFTEYINKNINVSGANRDWSRLTPETKITRTFEIFRMATFTNTPSQYTITIMDETKIKENNLNLILAVNKGSIIPARFIIIDNNVKSNDVICIVGKGVMYDTGGLNLKLKELEEMKTDMTGGAIVYGLLKGLQYYDTKKRVIGLIPLVQNEIGPNSTHPGDVVISASGLSVEIKDIDAEGRLIMADAITYAINNYKPTHIIDIATLTGYAVEHFNKVIPIVTNNEQMANDIKLCGDIENEEYVVELLPSINNNMEYIDLLKSDIADILNFNISKLPDHNELKCSSEFIYKFIQPYPHIKWCHMDIANTLYIRKGIEDIYCGGTGKSFRSLLLWLNKN